MSYRAIGRGLSAIGLATLMAALPVTVFAQPKPPADKPPADPSPKAPADKKAPADEPPAPPPDADIGADGDFGDEDLEEGPDPSRAPPKGKAAIWGVIMDATNDEPLMEAEVQLVGTGLKTIADLDGRYRFEVPPGRYTIRVWYPLYKPRVVEGVLVKADELRRIDEKLSTTDGKVEEMVVVAESKRSSLEGQINERKKATTVGDSVGRAEMSKTPDKNAAQAAKRVVGATIIGGRFVYVRGLGQRYTNALLDGAPLPSPEPDQQTVPLDLFPSSMLDGLTIAKGFTPDYPGDFAGGSVRISTRRVPDALTFSVSLGMGVNTQSTFRQVLTHDGGATDFLGIDDGTRSLSSDFPEYKLQRGIPRPDGSLITSADLQRYGRSLLSPMNSRRAMAPPNHSGSVVIGYGTELGKPDRRFGVMAALTYSRNFQFRENEIRRLWRNNPGGIPDETDIVLRNDLLFDRARERVRWGALGSATFELDKNHSFYLTGLQSVSSDKETREIEGSHEERGTNIHETRLGFVSRRLSFGQLRGRHIIDDLLKAELTWNLSLSYAVRAEPNRRSSVWEFDNDFGYRYEDDSQSGLHFYSNQTERSIGGGMNWSQPLGDSIDSPKVKFGTSVSLRDRTFESRFLRFRPPNGTPFESRICPVQTWDESCPAQLFTEQNLLPQGDTPAVLELEENTRGDSAYDAGLDVFSGYVMLDGAIGPLRLVVGQRIEASDLNINSFDAFDPDAAAVVGGVERMDLLPALSVTYRANPKTNLRGTISRTLARPQLRELGPFCYVDFFGAREICGNPDLEFTSIINADMRVEFFPTLREVLAASIFYKNFTNPIEQVVEFGKFNFQNADGANLIGLELEARKNFAFIAPPLRDLSLVSNLTLSRSRVQIAEGGTAAATVTNTSRPLAYQAPWVVNVSLDYDNDNAGTRARVLYNISGPAIDSVGLVGIPDIYLQPRHQLDVTAAQRIYEGLEVKASAKNITNDTWRWTHGTKDAEERAQRQFRTGVSFSVGASYRY